MDESLTRYCLTLNLKDDPKAIQEYIDYHQNVWPEILESIKGSGIQNMEIYRWHTRLFMIIEVTPEFSFEKKAEMDQANPVVQKWETLMDQYQEYLPGTPPGEKWQLMERIFKL